MKTAAVILATCAAFAATAAAASGGVTFNTPVTYTQPVTYSAGVTYLSQVTYAGSVNTVSSAAPVQLEGLVVTPTHTYTRSEWDTRMLARREGRSSHQIQARHTQRRGGDWATVMKAFLPSFN